MCLRSWKNPVKALTSRELLLRLYQDLDVTGGQVHQDVLQPLLTIINLYNYVNDFLALQFIYIPC